MIASVQLMRKFLALKVRYYDFHQGEIPSDEKPEVDDNVVMCSFMPRASSVANCRQCTVAYRLFCGDRT
ncbi:hypothetical protein EDD16DRAFT_118473 [Pisolithus croceorrhizus]|nr:hypothetical protein EDD16DRAFT_118473 [Pisolithus croceorrhizus]KAI6143180.1 hypothetical protein EDD17DRAFT_1660599 [Pisolithus thermaeus]